MHRDPELQPNSPPEIIVIPENAEISPEITEHITQVQKGEIQLPGPIDVGVHGGQSVAVQSVAPQQPRIVLPITQSDVAAGQNQPTTNAFRWLVEWVKRIILKNPGKTAYRTS